MTKQTYPYLSGGGGGWAPACPPARHPGGAIYPARLGVPCQLRHRDHAGRELVVDDIGGGGRLARLRAHTWSRGRALVRREAGK
jgi:hypothetical protein